MEAVLDHHIPVFPGGLIMSFIAFPLLLQNLIFKVRYYKVYSEIFPETFFIFDNMDMLEESLSPFFKRSGLIFCLVFLHVYNEVMHMWCVSGFHIWRNMSIGDNNFDQQGTCCSNSLQLIYFFKKMLVLIF